MGTFDIHNFHSGLREGRKGGGGGVLGDVIFSPLRRGGRERKEERKIQGKERKRNQTTTPVSTCFAS